MTLAWHKDQSKTYTWL